MSELLNNLHNLRYVLSGVVGQLDRVNHMIDTNDLDLETIKLNLDDLHSQMRTADDKFVQIANCIDDYLTKEEVSK